MSEVVTLKLDPEALALIQAGEAVPFAWRNENDEDVLLIVPTVWTNEAREEAMECMIDPDRAMNMLAIITLLRTQGKHKLGYRLLQAGWSPHEAFAAE